MRWKPKWARNVVWRFAAMCLGMVWVVAAHGASAKADAAADELFSSPVIRHLELEISPSGLRTLRQYVWQFPGNQSERVPVPATVREGERVYTNVAVHLKGEVGSFRPIDEKPALTVKFDKFVPGQLFHGLAKISLNNEVQDPTFMTDIPCGRRTTRPSRASVARLPGGSAVLTSSWPA